MSVVAEAFHLSPTAALQEIEEAPAGLIEQVLEARDYERRLRKVERGDNDREVDDMQQLVEETYVEIENEKAEREVAGLRGPQA